MTNEDYMRRAIELAKLGEGWTNPNPLVGAVIVKNGQVIGEGYHKKYGMLHAEREALANLSCSAEGATIYVTLEPCCHHGKQPPCTDALIEAGIKTVYIGSQDPNPLVAGKGVKQLREHGIEVIEDFLRDECDAINPVFFHYITTQTPYVVCKYAMTLDGKIATTSGESKWITGPVAREHVQAMRRKYPAILVGIGTVLADDPLLNCRIENARQPLRIVLDSKLRIPLHSKLVKTASAYETLVFCALSPEDEEFIKKAEALEAAGVKIVSAAEGDKVSIPKLLEYLGSIKIDSVLVEGGGEIHDAFRAANAIDHILCYIAPKVFGGKTAKTPIEGCGISSIGDALLFENLSVTKLGCDLLLEADVARSTI